MIDLRNKIKTATIKTRPEHSKNTNFHLALADYIFKELNKKGIEVKRKKDLLLSIKVGNVETHKYHSLIIDCLDGHIYAINKDSCEKRIGKLLSFSGNRTSDAFYCMKKSIDKIMKKINFYSMINEIEILEKKAKLIVNKDLKNNLKN